MKDNDKAMDQAVAKARETLGFFLAALKAKKPDSRDFEVKKCVIDGDNVEHLWLRDVSWDGKVFHGKVDNQPLDVANVRLGQKVTLDPQDLTDWMFVKDGKLMGGFTTRVLYSRLSQDEQARFREHSDFSIEKGRQMMATSHLRSIPTAEDPRSSREHGKRSACRVALVLIGAFALGVGGCVTDGYVGVSTYPSYEPYYGY